MRYEKWKGGGGKVTTTCWIYRFFLGNNQMPFEKIKAGDPKSERRGFRDASPVARHSLLPSCSCGRTRHRSGRRGGRGPKHLMGSGRSIWNNLCFPDGCFWAWSVQPVSVFPAYGHLDATHFSCILPVFPEWKHKRGDMPDTPFLCR